MRLALTRIILFQKVALHLTPFCAGTGNLKVALQQEQTSARSWSSRFSVFPEERAVSAKLNSEKASP